MYALDDAMQGFDDLMQRRVIGKICIDLNLAGSSTPAGVRGGVA